MAIPEAHTIDERHVTGPDARIEPAVNGAMSDARDLAVEAQPPVLVKGRIEPVVVYKLGG
jgi:hypothetical protein